MPRIVQVDGRFGNATKSLALSLSSDDQPVLRCSGALSFFGSGCCAGGSWSRVAGWSDWVTASKACAKIGPDAVAELVVCAANLGALHEISRAQIHIHLIFTPRTRPIWPSWCTRGTQPGG